MQVWAFCRAQAHLRKHLHSNGTLLHPGPDLDTLRPGVELLQQGRQQALKEGSWGVLGAGLSGRYGPFVGHKRSGGRFYPHMELSPLWTRFWQLMTREGGLATRQAAGSLGGVMGRAGSRPESQTWASLWGTSAVVGDFTLTWNLSPPCTRT